jgi:hypothetical protein
MTAPTSVAGPTAAEVSRGIAEAFDREGWKYNQMVSGDLIISFGRVTVWFRYLEDRRILWVACRNVEAIPATGPQAVDPQRALLITRLLLKANYDLLLSKFSVNEADGEIVLELSVPLMGNQVNPDLVHAVLGAVINTYNDFQPRIAALKYGTVQDADGDEGIRF